MRKLAVIAGSMLAGISLVGPLQGVADAQTGKLVVIVLENEPYANIVGNSQAQYLNQLIAQGELFTNYAGVADGSNPNYLAMTSGLTSALSPPAANIFRAIDASGGSVSWKEFMESMPGNCADGNSANVPGTSVALYTADHDPGYSYRSAITCSANDVPMTAATFQPASLPDLSYVVPNECDDMHTLPGSGQACPAYFGANAGASLISMGDNWLAAVVPPLLAQPNVTVLITWDEGSMSTTPPEHLVAVEAGAGVVPGSTDGTTYTHFGLEAGMYRYLGLGTAPGNGATATPLPIPHPASASPPVVSAVTPASGWPGTAVTVAGSGFTGATAVAFNGTAATFNIVSDTQLSATVPSGATTGPIAVTTPAGTGTSPSSFTVTAPPAPAITGVSPSSGPVGSTVTVTGSGFTGATAVTFNGTAATFTVASDTQLSATVPAGATTGPITVTTPAGTGTSPSSFTVTAPPAPAITGVSPSSGPVGSTVTVTGSGFTGATAVAFNGTAATFTVTSDTQLSATVPAGATTGPITVTTPAGTGTSPSSFTVTAPPAPAITGVSPSSGPVGSTVTVTGSGFTGATAVTFNGTAATFTVASDTQLSATVPSGATTGPITVTTPAGTGTSPSSFTVTAPPAPAITGVSPSSGPVGSTVTVTGSGFTGATAVAFNGTAATFTVTSDTQLSATVPAGATTGPITVTTPAGTGTSPSSFTVTAGPPSYYSLVTSDPTLLAYWRLGEASGTTATDTTGRYNGTYVNKPTLGSAGAIVNDPNTSVTFNGTSQRITLPPLPAAQNFSIEGWTYLTKSSVNNNTLYGNAGTVRLLARPGTGTYRTAAYAGVTLNGKEYVLQPISPASDINTWVYWVVTRQGGTLTLYRDGVQIGQRTDLPASATANINGYIADQANGNYYLNGRIDDVALYASALTASTIASHYQAALHGPAPG